MQTKARVDRHERIGIFASRGGRRRTRHEGTLVLLSDVHAQPMVALGRSALLDELGEDNVLGDVDAALERAAAYVAAPSGEKRAVS